MRMRHVRKSYTVVTITASEALALIAALADRIQRQDSIISLPVISLYEQGRALRGGHRRCLAIDLERRKKEQP